MPNEINQHVTNFYFAQIKFYTFYQYVSQRHE